jgi:glycine dehydrogenase subunit 1
MKLSLKMSVNKSIEKGSVAMGSYVPNTKQQQLEMLQEAGFHSFDEMFDEIPDKVRLKEELNIPQGVSELEAAGMLQEIADKNVTFRHVFRGAGAYRHYIPSIVKSIVNKEEFVTAYTPYQAEISQGILQSIFEYQTMICELTGLDASNASVYDGATAAAEAVAMCRERKRNTALISKAADPKVLQTIHTYCYGNGIEVKLIDTKDGETDLEALAKELTDSVACVYVQQPNYYGIIENAEKIGEIVHAAGAKYIMGCNPIALAAIKTPGESNADVAVGEGQPLGLPLAFGGPYMALWRQRRI